METRFKAVDTIAKAVGDRTFEFVISTGNVDREGDRIDPAGWQLADYNGVVLWQHDRSQPAIARSTVWVDRQAGALKARAEFPPDDVPYPLAHAVRGLLATGVLSSASVGFQPLESSPNEFGGYDFKRQALYEWSIVNIPALPDAALVGARDAGAAVAKWLGSARAKGVVPSNVSTALGPRDASWSAPSLGDFTSGPWSDLTDVQKRHIAGHFAWARELPPTTFGDLKLPHHDPQTGRVNFRGVVGCVGRLQQADIPGADLGAVKAHLRNHYRDFGLEPPAALRAIDDDVVVLDVVDEVLVDTADLAAAMAEVTSVYRDETQRAAVRAVRAAIDRVRGRIPDDLPSLTGDPAADRLRRREVQAIDVDPYALRAALREEVPRVLAEMTRAAAQREINRIRGRLD